MTFIKSLTTLHFYKQERHCHPPKSLRWFCVKVRVANYINWWHRATLGRIASAKRILNEIDPLYCIIQKSLDWKLKLVIYYGLFNVFTRRFENYLSRILFLLLHPPSLEDYILCVHRV